RYMRGICTASDLRLATLCYGPCHGWARPGACSTAVSDLNNNPRPLRPSGTVTLPALAPPITPPALPAPLPQPRNTPKPAGGHTHARPAQQLRSSPEYAARTAVRGRPWNRRRCAPTVLAA